MRSLLGFPDPRLEERASKVYGLWTFVKLVCLAESIQNDIETIEERDPMVQIAPREWPS